MPSCKWGKEGSGDADAAGVSRIQQLQRELSAANSDAARLARILGNNQTYHCTEEAEEALKLHEGRVKG